MCSGKILAIFKNLEEKLCRHEENASLIKYPLVIQLTQLLVLKSDTGVAVRRVVVRRVVIHRVAVRVAVRAAVRVAVLVAVRATVRVVVHPAARLAIRPVARQTVVS